MRPVITLLNPFKENICIVGMGQEGKTNFLRWVLRSNPNPYVCFDSIGMVSHGGFKPLKPDIQTIIKPRNAAERTPLFIQACRDAWAHGNMQFIVDELSLHCTKWQMPPELDTVINQGGNRNIGYVFTTRRVAQIHNDAIASAHHHIIFRNYLPQDVEWYGKVLPKEVILMSKDLPKYWFIYYQLGREPVVCKPVERV